MVNIQRVTQRLISQKRSTNIDTNHSYCSSPGFLFCTRGNSDPVTRKTAAAPERATPPLRSTSVHFAPLERRLKAVGRDRRGRMTSTPGRRSYWFLACVENARLCSIGLKGADGGTDTPLAGAQECVRKRLEFFSEEK